MGLRVGNFPVSLTKGSAPLRLSQSYAGYVKSPVLLVCSILSLVEEQFPCCSKLRHQTLVCNRRNRRIELNRYLLKHIWEDA